MFVVVAAAGLLVGDAGCGEFVRNILVCRADSTRPRPNISVGLPQGKPSPKPDPEDRRGQYTSTGSEES